MRYLVSYSGGLVSWASAMRICEKYGPENVILMFADVLMEDPDLYRFLVQTARAMGVELKVVTRGMNPWQLFRQQRFIGNTRVDLCSRYLKRELLAGHRDRYYDPADTVLVYGYNFDEEDRLVVAQDRLPKWRIEAPLIETPWLLQQDIVEWVRSEGIEPPRLYGMGFGHNNCGGFCVKAGHAQFAHLLKVNRPIYLWHEAEEQKTIRVIGKKVSILRDRRGGEVVPMTLREFRERLEGNTQVPLFAEMEALVNENVWGGCGCGLPV